MSSVNMSSVNMSSVKMSCGICMETIAKHPVICVGCNTRVCKPCLKLHLEHLLDTPLKTTCCMQCDKEFTKDFLSGMLTKRFVNEYYKILAVKREEIYIRNPSLFVQRSVQQVSMTRELENLKKEIIETRNEIKKTRAHYKNLVNRRKELQKKCATTIDVNDMKCSKCSDGHIDLKTMQCYLCTKKHCKTCNKIAEYDDHKCNEDDLATKIYIERNIKHCPFCKTPVERTNGCTHVYCTICKGAFDYFTMYPLDLKTVIASIPDFKRDASYNMNSFRDPLDVICGGYDEKKYKQIAQKNPFFRRPLMRIYETYTKSVESYREYYNKRLQKNNELEKARIRLLTNSCTKDAFNKRIRTIESKYNTIEFYINTISIIKDSLLDILRLYEDVDVKDTNTDIHNNAVEEFKRFQKYIFENFRNNTILRHIVTPTT